jgi:hypothetical protein
MTVTTAQARYQAELYRVTGTPVAASIVASLCDQLDALTLAFETERDAANLYAKQVAHWIGKHDALLEQQLSAQPSQAGGPATPTHFVWEKFSDHSNGQSWFTKVTTYDPRGPDWSEDHKELHSEPNRARNFHALYSGPVPAAQAAQIPEGYV